jgi:SAM-dependent methyltransferase
MSGCSACGALWLDPRPTAATVGEAYQSYYTHGSPSFTSRMSDAVIVRVARERAASMYGFGGGTWGISQLSSLFARLYPGLADHADSVIKHLPASALGQGGKILDVGCGDGGGIAFLNSLGWRASGVEVDPRAVLAAQAKGLDVVAGDIASAGFADESFDAVTSSHVIEHLHDPRAFFAESFRILKPGGTLVATTPNASSELLARHGLSWRGLEPPRHIILYNAENLAKLATEAGLREVGVKRTAHVASFMHLESVRMANSGVSLKGWPFVRLWLESKSIERRMSRDVRLGRAEGTELTLIARK